jgi:type VI secretion system secreted protein Hcp
MAIDMYLKVEGATGESQDANHKEWIDIASYSWGATQQGTMSGGGGGGAGKVSFSDLTVAANLDKATPALLKYCASGKHVSEVKLSICKAGGTQIEYSTIVLKDVIVTSVQTSNAAGLEQVAMNYSFQASQVEQHYWVQSKDGTKGAESQMGWDVKANKVTA